MGSRGSPECCPRCGAAALGSSPSGRSPPRRRGSRPWRGRRGVRSAVRRAPTVVGLALVASSKRARPRSKTVEPVRVQGMLIRIGDPVVETAAPLVPGDGFAVLAGHERDPRACAVAGRDAARCRRAARAIAIARSAASMSSLLIWQAPARPAPAPGSRARPARARGRPSRRRAHASGKRFHMAPRNVVTRASSP